MAEITRSECQAFLDSLGDCKHLRFTTIRSVHRVMMTRLNSAEIEDVITKNRLGRMEYGKEPKPVDISPAQLEEWFTAASKVFNRYDYAMINIASIGLRRGEVLGLRTTSINFQQNEVIGDEIASLKIDLQRTEDYKNGGPLKNDSSYRTLWVEGDLVEHLHRAILTSNNRRMINNIVVCSKTKAKPWLWMNTVGRGVSAQYLKDKMDLVNKTTGLYFRPHMLRHYFATRTINTNASDIEVMRYLGHKNLQMTADYTRP